MPNLIDLYVNFLCHGIINSAINLIHNHMNELRDSTDREGNSLIMLTLKFCPTGLIDTMVNFLVKNHFSIISINRFGETALSLALDIKNIYIAHRLVQMNPDIPFIMSQRIKYCFKLTDLLYFIWSGEHSKAILLLENANYTINEYETNEALKICAYFNYHLLLKILLLKTFNNPFKSHSYQKLIQLFPQMNNITFWLLKEKKIYAFNPHRHVKIWLSKEPSSFLNLTNQLRLIQMRQNCPDDNITFVFDSRLLDVNAIDKLSTFCQRWNIFPYDVVAVLNQKNFTDKESELLKIYQLEIENLHQDGNVAVASDILRLLRPIIRYGIYTDFDVKVKTIHLPNEIPIYSDTLFNLGTICYEDGSEAIDFNNDIIAFIDSNSPKIEQMQDLVLTNYQSKSLQQWLIYPHFREFDQEKIIAFFNHFPNKLSPIEFRSMIPEIIKIYLSVFYRSENNNYPALEDLYLSLEIESVVNATGPAALLKYFLERGITSNTVSEEHIHQSLAPSSLSAYSILNGKFISSQPCFLHLNQSDYYALQKSGDLSWTKLGNTSIKQNEAQKELACLKIQSFFRSKKTSSINLDSQSQENRGMI